MNNNFYYPYDDNANCSYGCENANQCEYNHGNFNYNNPQQQQHPSQQNQQQIFDNTNYQFANNNFNNFDDSVVPRNFYENNTATNNHTSINNYQVHHVQQQQNFNSQLNFYSTSNAHYETTNQYNNTTTTVAVATANNTENPINYVNNEYFQTYPPCQGPQPWNFAHCYGYYGDSVPCQFSNVIDMEDFM